VAAGSENMAESGTERPVVIVALMLATTVGDFIEYNLFAAWMKRRYANARLIAYYRRDRAFKDAVIAMNTAIDEVWAKDGLDHLKAEHFNVDPDDFSDPNRQVDVLLTPRMMDRTALPTLQSAPAFRIPADRQDELRSRLTDAGVDPDRWFCVLHYREPNFEGRGAHRDRDLAPGDALAVTRFVIEELGGQVVRIGHPEMEAFADMPGFVDLSRDPVDFMLQAMAVSHARFFLELSPSGPMSLALGFGVPVARCNNIALWGPVGEDGVVLVQHLVAPDGTEVPLRDCVQKNLLNGYVVPFMLDQRGFRYQRNTLEELFAAARAVHTHTENCVGWREPDKDTSSCEPGAIQGELSWPIAASWRHHVMGLDGEAGAAEGRST